jgi:hypothetical protein
LRSLVTSRSTAMAFAFRTAFAVGVATVGAGATLMSTVRPLSFMPATAL